MVGFYVKENQRRRQHVLRLQSAREEAATNLAHLQKTENVRIENQKTRTEREKKNLKTMEDEIKFNRERVEEVEHQYTEDLNNQTRKLHHERE
jgi:hypothetical protein